MRYTIRNVEFYISLSDMYTSNSTIQKLSRPTTYLSGLHYIEMTVDVSKKLFIS